MNPLDLGVIAIVVLSALFAFARGFVREALSIVAWGGAAAATLYGFNWVYAQVELRMHDRLLAQLIAGFGLFVTSLIVLTILTGFVARMVRSSGLSPIDRTLGFVFGLVRGAFLVCLAYLALEQMLPTQTEWPAWIREAKSDPYLHEGADVLKGLLPESFKIKTNEVTDTAIKAVSPAIEAKRAMDALTNPSAPPAAKPDSPPPPSYREGEQRALDRLIGTQR